MDTRKTGQFICEERKKMNYTQKQLANLLNVTDKAVSRWETGKGYPDIEILVKLSNLFNVSVNELLNGERVEQEKISEIADEQIVIAYRKESNTKTKSKIAVFTVFIICVLFCGLFAKTISTHLNIKEETFQSFTTDSNFTQLTQELQSILENTYRLQFYDIFAEVICTNFTAEITKSNQPVSYSMTLIDLYNRNEFEITFDTQNCHWNIKKTKVKEISDNNGVQIKSMFDMIRNVDFLSLCEKSYYGEKEYNNILLDFSIGHIFTGREANVSGHMYLFENNKVVRVKNTKDLIGTYYCISISPKPENLGPNQVFSSCCNVYVRG